MLFWLLLLLLLLIVPEGFTIFFITLGVVFGGLAILLFVMGAKEEWKLRKEKKIKHNKRKKEPK